METVEKVCLRKTHVKVFFKFLFQMYETALFYITNSITCSVVTLSLVSAVMEFIILQFVDSQFLSSFLFFCTFNNRYVCLNKHYKPDEWILLL